jgi:hypothetical protein
VIKEEGILIREEKKMVMIRGKKERNRKTVD